MTIEDIIPRRDLDYYNPEMTREPITDEECEQICRRIKEAGDIKTAQIQKQREKKDNDVTQLMAELNELRKLIPYEEEMTLEEALKEAEEYYKAIPMYDWGAKEMSNEFDMSQKYGTKITYEISECICKGNPVPKRTVAEMHLIHEGKLPRPTNKPLQVVQPVKALLVEKISQVKWEEVEQRTSLIPKEYTNEHFSTVKAGLFNVTRGNRDLQNPTTLLLYLLQHRAWEGKKDKHDTYDTWYMKRRLIVASVSVERMCTDMGVHEKTVRNWTNTLHKRGIIRKLKDGLEIVYVLGEVINEKDLFYYSGEIHWKAESGLLH